MAAPQPRPNPSAMTLVSLNFILVHFLMQGMDAEYKDECECECEFEFHHNSPYEQPVLDNDSLTLDEL